MTRFSLSELQANAILDMRLRSLRRLEEEGLKTERDGLIAEQEEITALLADESLQWTAIEGQIKSMKQQFAASDKRLTRTSAAPEIDLDIDQLLIERELITVICSAKGWVRAMKGHLDLNTEFKFKEGDEAGFVIHAETTDKILFLAENGRFYTLAGDKLPRGRGFGEPLNLMLDISADASIVAMLKAEAGKLLLASTTGHGMVIDCLSAIAQTRTGKQILNLSGEARAAACIPATGDMVAVVGQNRKLLVFSLSEVPELAKGKGVILQRYKDGGLADIKVFDGASGLSWQMGGGRTRTETDLTVWIGRRGSAGKMPPTGFPRPARFT